MNLVANISSLSDSLGVPVEELPESIKSSKELLEDTNLTIKNRVFMLKRVNENYNVTMTDLEEYRRDRPLIETLKAKKLELEKAKKRIFDLEAELFKMQCEWSASNYELDLVNIEMNPPVESGELYNLAKDLYLHPSKHPDVIRTMRQRSGSQAALVDTNKVNIFNPPPPSVYSPTTLFSLPPSTPPPICRINTTNQNPTQPTQSEFSASLPGLLEDVNPRRPVNLTGANPGVDPNVTGPSLAGPNNKIIPTPIHTNKTLPNPSTSTTITAQLTNTIQLPPFNNSTPNPPPTHQNTTTAITPLPPPSATALQVVDLEHRRIIVHQPKHNITSS